METKRTTWIVTRSDRRMKFEDLDKVPYGGGPLSRLNLTDIDMAASMFGAWSASLEIGCVQIFDAISKREHGFFML